MYYENQRKRVVNNVARESMQIQNLLSDVNREGRAMLSFGLGKQYL